MVLKTSKLVVHATSYDWPSAANSPVHLHCGITGGKVAARGGGRNIDEKCMQVFRKNGLSEHYNRTIEGTLIFTKNNCAN